LSKITKGVKKTSDIGGTMTPAGEGTTPDKRRKN